MIRIENNCVQLDNNVAEKLSQIIAEDEASSLELFIDDKWTLIINIVSHHREPRCILVNEALWESVYSA